MATAQLADLTDRFNALATMSKEEATGLAGYLDDGGLVQLSQGLSAELEKKGASKAKPRDSAKRYMQYTLRQRYMCSDFIDYFVTQYGRNAILNMGDDRMQYEEDMRAIAIFLSGMGYTLEEVTQKTSVTHDDGEVTYTSAWLQELIDRFNLGTPPNSYLLWGVINSIIETKMERNMVEEIKLRQEFYTQLLEVKLPAFVEAPLREYFEDEDRGALEGEELTRAIQRRSAGLIAGSGFSPDDVRRFSRDDWNYILAKHRIVKPDEYHDATSFEFALMF